VSERDGRMEVRLLEWEGRGRDRDRRRREGEGRGGQQSSVAVRREEGKSRARDKVQKIYCSLLIFWVRRCDDGGELHVGI
jgi:hypothetical protein